MIDPHDKRTVDLVELASGRPGQHLAELIEATESSALPQDEADDPHAGPLDAAARQRKARAKRKALGKKAVWLTDVERLAVQCALELLHDIPAPGLAATLDAALEAVAPGAKWPAAAKPVPRVDASQVESLRRQVEHLEKDNSALIAERSKAFEAVEVLQNRLRRAFLPSDYRRQPGE
jgi:UDP:flavonoid glycosyltransferase YjiC (YdhE family)